MKTTSAAEVFREAGRPDDGAAGVRLSELFARHGATVLGLCRVLLRNQHEAEDAVQQTFLAAYRSLLNGVEPRHPAAWLATIARNECWALISRRMREPIAEAEPVSTLPDPVAAAASRADLAELWRAIGELPPQQRQALLMREFSGLSYDELAEALAVSEPAVESLLFRARRQLRVRLRPVGGTAASVAPLAAIRDALARAIGGMPDPSSVGLLAKVASVPLVAKLAFGAAAAVVVAGGTVAAVSTDAVRSKHAPAPASVAARSRVTFGPEKQSLFARARRPRARGARRGSVRGGSPISPRQAPAGVAAPLAGTAASSGAATSGGSSGAAGPPVRSGDQPATGGNGAASGSGGSGHDDSSVSHDPGSSGREGPGSGGGSGSSGSASSGSSEPSDDPAGDDGGGSPDSDPGAGGDDHDPDSGGGDGGADDGDGGGGGGDGGGAGDD